MEEQKIEDLNALEINVRDQKIRFIKDSKFQNTGGWFTLSENVREVEYKFFLSYFKARGLPFKKYNLVECWQECEKILGHLSDLSIILEQK